MVSVSTDGFALHGALRTLGPGVGSLSPNHMCCVQQNHMGRWSSVTVIEPLLLSEGDFWSLHDHIEFLRSCVPNSRHLLAALLLHGCQGLRRDGPSTPDKRRHGENRLAHDSETQGGPFLTVCYFKIGRMMIKVFTGRSSPDRHARCIGVRLSLKCLA